MSDETPLCDEEFWLGDGRLFARCQRPQGHSGVLSKVHMNTDTTTWYEKEACGGHMVGGRCCRCGEIALHNFSGDFCNRPDRKVTK